MAKTRQSLRIGTDIGGTFTDFVAIYDVTGALRLEKTLTTRDEALAFVKAEFLSTKGTEGHETAD